MQIYLVKFQCRKYVRILFYSLFTNKVKQKNRVILTGYTIFLNYSNFSSIKYSTVALIRESSVEAYKEHPRALAIFKFWV